MVLVSNIGQADATAHHHHQRHAERRGDVQLGTRTPTNGYDFLTGIRSRREDGIWTRWKSRSTWNKAIRGISQVSSVQEVSPICPELLTFAGLQGYEPHRSARSRHLLFTLDDSYPHRRVPGMPLSPNRTLVHSKDTTTMNTQVDEVESARAPFRSGQRPALRRTWEATTALRHPESGFRGHCTPHSVWWGTLAAIP